MTQQFDVQAAIAAAAAKAPNMNEAVAGGGGEYEMPAAGMARCRLVGYFEIGKHSDEYEGKVKTRDKVQLVFELSGPKHQPREHEGVKYPHRLTITESMSLNEKANFYKLFKRLNYKGEATHFAQLLGQDFICTVVHKATKDGKRKYPVLRDDAGYTIRPPFVPNPETGDDMRVTADPAITPIKLFLWDFPSKEMWDSIFIDGMYEEQKDDKGVVTRPAKSKNVIQNTIKSAENYQGSPICELLGGGDALAELEQAATPERKPENVQAAVEAQAGASADPLNGM